MFQIQRYALMHAYDVKLSASRSMGGQEVKYNGIWGSLSTMIREEGVRGFFKVRRERVLCSLTDITCQGNGTNCIRIAPYSAVQFYTFENCKQVRCSFVVVHFSLRVSLATFFTCALSCIDIVSCRDVAAVADLFFFLSFSSSSKTRCPIRPGAAWPQVVLLE